MLRVIVNSTPLLSLGAIGKLDIFRQMYTKIIIPEAVYQEVMAKQDIASESVQNATKWIDVQSIENRADYAMYRSRLHAGEIEVMILAQQEPRANLVIIDDIAARKTAAYLGIPMAGTVGVLIKAKQKGVIVAVKPILEDLENNGFFISDKVKKMIAEKTRE